MIEHKMRRKDRQCDEQTALKILTDSDYGVFSTVGEDGYPYGVPVNYVVEDDKIYFHCAFNAGHKQENLNFSNKVCFTAVESSEVDPQKRSTRYRSAIAFGKAKRMTDNRRHALELILDKYCADYKEGGLEEINQLYEKTDVIEITIEKITGKIHL